MRTLLTHQAWIALAAGAVFFIGLGASRLWDDDEAKNATCAREMRERGDWIVPTFNSKLRTDKPVLLYWLMLGSYGLFGATEFAARLPSALLAVGTSLLTYHLGRRLFRPEVGLWAGLVLATSLMFSIDGRAATPDSTLVFCTTAALTAFAWSIGGSKARYRVKGTGNSLLTTNLSAWLLIDTALAMGVLAKGPVGAVMPLAAIGLFLLLIRTAPQSPPMPEHGTLASHLKHAAQRAIRRIGRCLAVFPQTVWSMRPVTLLAVVAMLALPWYLAVGLATGGEWPREFFWKHNVERFVTPMEGHGGPAVFQFVALAIGFFPWTLTLIAGLAECAGRIRRQEPDSRACLLLLTWSAVWIGLFSLCRTKLPNYVLPTYPALAVAAGLWIANWIASPARVAAARWMQLGWGLLAVGSVAFTIALAIELPRRMPEAPNFAWIGIVPLVGAVVGWTLQRVRLGPAFRLPGGRLKPGLQHRRQAALSVAALVATAAAFCVLLFNAAIAPLSRLQTSQLTAQVIRRLGDQPVRVGQFVLRLPGLVYYDGPHVEEPITWDDVKDFFRDSDTAILVTNPQAWRFVGPLVPHDVVILERQREFPKRGEVLVVGRISNPKSEISNSKSQNSNSESLASRPSPLATVR